MGPQALAPLSIMGGGGRIHTDYSNITLTSALRS